MKARVYLLGLLCLCSACAAPSLRYKTEVNKLVSGGKFAEAESLVSAKQKKMYANQDYALAFLDRATLLHDAQNPAQSDHLLAQAQDRIEDLYTKSATKQAGRLLINDLTAPYEVGSFERALTYFYRAMNFLQQNQLMDAAVEARKAVFFLDQLRGSKTKGYNDDPFVQYFASLIFESVGQRSDARIARQNALNAYANLGGLLKVAAPEFSVPANAAELGEVIVVHYNGLLPLKKTATIQVAWDRIMAIVSAQRENRYYSMSPEVENAINAGWMGHAVTLSYPVLEPQHYMIASSFVEAGGQTYSTQKVADIATAAKLDLEERMPGIWFRTASRAVAKQIAAEQARQAARSATNDDAWGDLAGMVVNIFGAAVEKADTRQWFTLPAEVRMTRLFLSPGEQNIRLLFRNRNGNIVGEHVFENVAVPRGGRVFLHVRTAH